MSLRTATFSATRWSATSAVARAALQMCQMAVLARLLEPADFGLMAIAGGALALASLLADLGLGSALMHFAKPDQATLSTIYWLNLLSGCVLAAFFAIVAWPVSAAYGLPDLLPVLVVLAAIFPLTSLGLPFRVLAEKDLRFRPLAQNEVVAALMGFGGGLLLAVKGGGVYALVLSSLLTAFVSSILAWIRLSGGVRPGLALRPGLAKPFIGFGLHRIGDGFWNTLRLHSDVLVAGLVAAPSAVALYSVPRELCMRVAGNVINPVVTRVSLPLMPRLQPDPENLRTVYLHTCRVVASFNFPIYALLAVFAEDAIRLLLGPQWQQASFYLRLFAVWGLIRSTGNPAGSVLYAVGMAKRAHIWNMILFFAVVPALWIAARAWGLPGLAWVMVVSQAVLYGLAWRFLIRPACGATFAQYNGAVMRPLAASSGASLVTIAVLAWLPAPFRLMIGGLVFSMSYLGLSWAWNREWLKLILELVRPALSSFTAK